MSQNTYQGVITIFISIPEYITTYKDRKVTKIECRTPVITVGANRDRLPLKINTLHCQNCAYTVQVQEVWSTTINGIYTRFFAVLHRRNPTAMALCCDSSGLDSTVTAMAAILVCQRCKLNTLQQ